MSFFSAKHISAGYGKNHIIKDVSFEIEKGCMLGILGANGSGKTTLLKAMCGILPHTGSCMLEGRRLEELSFRQTARLCSYIPQRSGISIDIPALDVVMMGFNPHMRLLEHPTSEMKRISLEALDKVGLSGKSDVHYQHLSEGQKQLCIMARTFVSGSRLMLLDEPESALDFRYRYQMLDMIKDWVSETSGGAVLTLHDPMLALNYCDKLLLLSDGEILGTVLPKEDPPEKAECLLREIYGPVSLVNIRNRSGKRVMTMLKEDDR